MRRTEILLNNGPGRDGEISMSLFRHENNKKWIKYVYRNMDYSEI